MTYQPGMWGERDDFEACPKSPAIRINARNVELHPIAQVVRSHIGPQGFCKVVERCGGLV
jgi:hypothetical protein